MVVGQGTSGGTSTTVASDPRQALEQVERYLTSQGYARTGPAVRNPNLGPNGVIAYPVDAQPNLCYTIVALAGPNTDLDLVVLDPAGRTISYDVNPDPHPWSTVCPGLAGRVVARLQMGARGGEYYYAVYQGTPDVRPNLAALFEGQQSGPQQAAIDPDTQQRLSALDAQLNPEGFHRIAEPYGEVYSEREDRYFSLNLTQGTCYAFATLGGPTARDTDVFLVDGQGNEIVRDVSPSGDAIVRYCAQQTGAYRLRARMYTGSGALFTVGYVQGQGGEVATQGEQVISTQTTAGIGLDENFRLLDSDMHARGYESYGQPSRSQLTESQTQDYPIELEGGKCYALLAVGDNGVRDLDLIVMDASDHEVDRDVETDARPIVRVCAQQTGRYKMQVRMYSGQGNIVYAAYRWPLGTSGPFNLQGLIWVRLAEMTKLLEVEGYTPDVQNTPARGHVRRQGQSARHNIQLEGGQCYAVLAVGGDGVNNLDLKLMDGSNVVASDTTRTAFPDVRFCPPSSGRFAMEVTATNGAGDYFYEVLRRGAQ